MTQYVQQLHEAVRAVGITSPTSFTWFGTPSEQLPRRVRRAIDPPAARSHLLFTLSNHLYNNFYRLGFASPTPSEGEAPVSCQQTQLWEELTAANCGSGCWEPRWVVDSVAGKAVAVRRDGLQLWVGRQDCLAADGAPIAPGAEVSLRVPKESFGISPGYYSIVSDEALVWDGESTLVRVYWNVRPEGAARLVGSVSSGLNGARVPFRLKVLDDAIAYGRCDTAVLYLLKRDVPEAAGHLATAVRDCADAMRPGTPAFTKEIGPGVGLAEEVGQGESFGQHRCQVLARGLIQAFENRRSRLDSRLRTVVDLFGESGIDLDRPYLKAGAVDDYDLRLQPKSSSTRRPVRWPDERAASRAFLGVAEEIGRKLASEAVWHRDRCNWLGLLPHAYGRHQLGLSYGALGHDLYDGTSGIALFLAELASVGGSSVLRRTALGAIRQALRVTEDRGDRASVGLYTGSTGIALAAATIGLLLGEPSLVERATRVVAGIAGDTASVHGFDLLSGRAGAVTALLTLHELLEDQLFADLAVRLGDELMASAEVTEQGWSWTSDDGGDHRNLTGLSHGAAGAGHALLELCDLTAEPRYGEAAQEAFRYERSWFSGERGNWPDFRDEPARRGAKRFRTYRTQWCHGAPGIALSRLRACEILGDPAYREEAVVALATTARETAEAELRGSLSFCLCHGLAGNADVLLDGEDLLGDGHGGGRRLARDIGTAGMEAYGTGRLPWPCGVPVPGQETPGLMLGLAGIGHFYLRLAFPASVPSLLLLRRQDFARRLGSLTALRSGAEVAGTAGGVPAGAAVSSARL